MNVSTTKKNNSCTLTVEGRIDTYTAPELEKEVNANLPYCDKMIFDVSKVDYVSSAGLRVFVYAQRELVNRGDVVLKGMNSGIEDVINMTGLNALLKIEK